MTVAWVDESRTIEKLEGEELDVTFHCVTNVEPGHQVEIVFLSSSLPSSIDKEVLWNGDNIIGLRLYGVMPSILNEETYRLTARLQEYHTTGSTKNKDYFEDASITIINHINPPSWKLGYNIPVAYAKSAYSTEMSKAVDNTNGDEIYRKSSGILPSSMTLYPDGTISGTPLPSEITFNPDADPEDQRIRDPYIIGVTVYRNNEVILEEKQFSLEIYPENKKIPPTWITESGMIGTVNAGDNVTDLKVIATISSDETDLPQDKVITYKVVELGDEIPAGCTNGLPPGLTLSSQNNQGVIYGLVATAQVTSYVFSICPYRQYRGVWYPADPSSSVITDAVRNASRTFSILANKPAQEHEITWGNEGEVIDGGSFQIGSVINDSLPKAVAADGYPITYTIIDRGTLPSYIDIDELGNITGTAQYPISTYYCYVRASTEFTYVTRKVEIKISKGLGYNALNLSLRINLEYRDQYNEIKNELNPAASYGNGQEGYDVEVFPKIDVATLTCFDRELLAGIFNYGNPEVIRFLETRYKTYTDEDVNGDATVAYEAYYKAVDESTYQWDAINNGNFDFEQELQKEKDLTSAYDGETYINPPFMPMENDAEIEFNKKYYNSVVDQKQWLPSLIETGEYELANAHITTSPQVEYKVFNFKNVREDLQKKIYVYKNIGEFYFDLGNQQLFSVEGIEVKKLYDVDGIDEEGKQTTFYYICDENATPDPEHDDEVKYIEHKIYDIEDTLLINTLFKPTFDTHPFMVDEEEEIYNLERISNPWCLDFNKEENNWLSMDKIPEGAEMCLPRISDEDVSDDGTYIQMLDPRVEPLPKWKRKEAIYWEAETTYNVGDILYYDSKYYLVIKKFKTEYAFEYDTENMRLLTNDEVKDQLSKQYFPTLDLGYYRAGKNRAYLKRLNDAEKKGKFWYNKDFFFWEVTCYPVYNESIETFGVPFYSTERDEKHDGEYGKKTYELIVNYPSSGYTVALAVNGVDIITASSAIKQKYEYTHSGNSYRITVNHSTSIRWAVTAGEEYYPQSGTYIALIDYINNVSLIKKAKLTIEPTPEDATVKLTAVGYTQSGNSMYVYPGTEVEYKVSKDGYRTESGTVTVNSSMTLPIRLTEMVTAIVVPEPNTGMATITITAPGYTQQGNSITVPKGTGVNIIVRCPGFFDEEVNTTVLQNGNIIVPLEEDWIIYGLTDEENNVLISEQGNTLTSEVYPKTRE